MGNGDLRRILAAAVAVVCALSAGAAFRDGKGLLNRRLGMFIHWGVYSVGGFHEQDFWMTGKTRAQYEAYKDAFRAENFDPDHFIDVAESAGAEYIVITSKHHDGFCLWDTATTDYNAAKSPAGRDILGELAAACRRRGMKLGLYYSNPDWHCPFAHNTNSTHQVALQAGDAPDLERYIAYEKAQITELLTRYGEIACWFWDIPTGVKRPEMDAFVRKLQPGILINNRGWMNEDTCDYATPERELRDGEDAARLEACNSVGAQSWGYRANEDYHSVGSLTRGIDYFLSRGGNYLLNVGPKSDGRVTDEAQALMRRVGAWHRNVREAFVGVENVPPQRLRIVRSPFAWAVGQVRPVPYVLTRRGTTFYVHYPEGGADATGVDLAPFAAVPVAATLLNTGKRLEAAVEMMPANRFFYDRESLHVWGIPIDDLANECLVIRLDFTAEQVVEMERAGLCVVQGDACASGGGAAK